MKTIFLQKYPVYVIHHTIIFTYEWFWFGFQNPI